MSKRLKESVGKEATIFLKNGFRFRGKITGCDETYVELLEPRGYKILTIEEISDLNVEVGE